MHVDASNNIYIGGSFNDVGKRIAKWNGSSWDALGSGLNNDCEGISTDTSGDVFAVGEFTVAGAVGANRVAQWNGSAWSALSTGLNDIGFAVAVEGWQGYFPFGHFGGGNMIPEQVKNYIKKICALPCRKIFHNAQYDVGWLEAEGFKVNGEIVDTMIAAAIIDENRFS